MRFLSLLVLVTLVSVSAQAQESLTEVYNAGVEQMRAKAYGEAYGLFEKAVALGTADADSSAMKTVSLAKKNGAKAAYGQGVALRKTKDYEGSLKVSQQGIDWDADYYGNYIGVAKSLDKLKRTEDAITAYFVAAEKSEAAKRKADKVASLYRKAFLKLYKGKKYDAILENAEKYPNALNAPDINYYMAKALDAKGSAGKAVAYAAKAGELGTGKNVGKYYSLLGDLYTKLTKVDNAIAAYKKVPADSKYSGQAKYNIEQLSNK